MSTAKKKRVAQVAVIILWLYPLAHYGAYRALDFNPWRFAGWAMYCQPTDFDPTLDVIGFPTGRAVSLEGADKNLNIVISRFKQRRAEYGWLSRPDAVAAAVFKRHPEFNELTIKVGHRRFAWGGVADRTRTYSYRR